MYLLFTLVVLLVLIVPFKMYRLCRIREVREYGKDLYLAGKVITRTAKSQHGVTVATKDISFSDYRFVTDKNPYGTVLALNRPKSQQPLVSGNYPIRYLKKGERIFLIILDK